MPRLQIELTSARPDGVWTWRAAGARQPKGTIPAGLLPPHAKVGDVLRVDADVELEGTTVTAVLPEAPKRAEPERLELLGSPVPFEAVTTSLLPKGARPRHNTWDAGTAECTPRPGIAGEARGPRRSDRGTAANAPARPGAPIEGRQGPTGRSSRGERSTRGSDRPRAPERPGDRAVARSGSERAERATHPNTSRSPVRRVPERVETPPPAPRPKRLSPASVHRTAALDALPPEQRAVAEQVLQGGIPAVRRAVQEQNTERKTNGEPEIKADAIVSLAEELLPRLKRAEWRDRAEAAAADADEIGLRDLRSVVAGADAARDDESRMLAKTLREALDRREVKSREDWISEIGRCLDEGRLVRALRVSSRPPDLRTRLPAELAARLSEAAGSALAPDVLPDRWLTVLEAVIESPVRRSVKPGGLPSTPVPAVLSAARQASGRVPALAGMLGIDIPPPPGPARPGVRPSRPAAARHSPRGPHSTSPMRPVAPPAPASPPAAPVSPSTNPAPPAPNPAPNPAPEEPLQRVEPPTRVEQPMDAGPEAETPSAPMTDASGPGSAG